MLRHLSVTLLVLSVAAAWAQPSLLDIRPAVQTESMPFDVDDPSIWINAKDRSQSLIVGTVKVEKPNGALVVFSMAGKLLETVSNLDRPDNVDIVGDIAVTTERLARQLRVFRVSADKPHLRPIGNVPVFMNEQGEAGAPMGIALYERPRDRALFALVSRKTGPLEGYLWQYRLRIEGSAMRWEKVRAFGGFSGMGEIEAVAVDQTSGLVYYSDEDCCIRVYRADPDVADANREVARFADKGFRGNREGIAIAGTHVIVTDQLDPQSEYHVFDRQSRREVAIWRGMAQSTDGIDATAEPLGAAFPHGLLITMNNAQRNFHLYTLP